MTRGPLLPINGIYWLPDIPHILSTFEWTSIESVHIHSLPSTQTLSYIPVQSLVKVLSLYNYLWGGGGGEDREICFVPPVEQIKCNHSNEGFCLMLLLHLLNAELAPPGKVLRAGKMKHTVVKCNCHVPVIKKQKTKSVSRGVCLSSGDI